MRGVGWFSKEPVDMAVDEDNLSALEAEVDSPGGVGDDEEFDTEFGHGFDRQGSLFDRPTFVEVGAALHGDNGDGLESSEHQFACMAWDVREGEPWDFAVIDFGGGFDLIREWTESAAEDQTDAGLESGAGLANELGSVFQRYIHWDRVTRRDVRWEGAGQDHAKGLGCGIRPNQRLERSRARGRKRRWAS